MIVQKWVTNNINRYKKCAITINCLNTLETYTDWDKLIQNWGREEVDHYYAVNTREVVIDIK